MTVGDVYAALWRRKWMLLLSTALVVAATWFFTSRQTPIYSASTLVKIQQPYTDPSQTFGILEGGQRLAESYAEITKTTTIADRIYRSLHGAVPRSAIRSHISGTPAQDVPFLTISARSPSPSYAKRIANAAPAALESFVKSTGSLRETVIVVERATTPTSPVSPNMKLNLALALIGGLIFNGGLVLLAEVLADRLPDMEELERMAGKPILATVPTLQFARGRGALRQSVARRPSSARPVRRE